MVYVIQIRKLSANLYDIYHCCVYSKKTPGDGQRNCPKHVEFYSKNKFEKLVHLVDFIIRIYHDARSSERQIQEILNFSMYCRHALILAPLKSRAGGVSTPRDVNGVISCD